MKIYNLTVMSDNNAGDKLASPLDYFDFPVETVKVDNKAAHEHLRGKFIIFGGGGLIHIPSEDYNNGIMAGFEYTCGLSPWLVAWGVGHNIHRSTKIEYPASFVNKFRMIGVRDMGQSLPWVPCVSCMNDLFHHDYNIKYSCVACGHDLDSFSLGVPSIEHVGVSPSEIVPFIASGETVLTNSYHGAYWGLLLNRKVIVFDPMSSKFYGLPKNIALATPKTWREAKPTSDNVFLNLCRVLNQEYHKRVLKLLGEYLET